MMSTSYETGAKGQSVLRSVRLRITHRCNMACYYVRYAEAAPFLLKALDACIESGQRFEGLWGKCGVPLCVLGGNPAYFPRARVIPEEDRSPDFMDVPACGVCAVKDRRFRIRKLYIKLYGTGEFNPVKKSGGLRSVRQKRQGRT